MKTVHNCWSRYEFVFLIDGLFESRKDAWFQVIGDCHSNQIDDEVVTKYRAVGDSRDRELFLDFCLHTILYQQSSQRSGTLCTV